MEYDARNKVEMWCQDLKQKLSDNPKSVPLLKWILANFILMAVSLSHIYTIPMFADITNSRLNVTIYDSFEKDFDLECDQEEPFCGLIWVKLVFFIGFAASQFSVGFFADRFGPYNLLKLDLRILLVSGIGATISGNVYIFCATWFFVAFASTSVFLLTVSSVLENLDEHINDWKWRLIIGCMYQMSWNVGRYLSNITVYACSEWFTVKLFLIMLLAMILFTLEKHIFESEFSKRECFQGSFTSLIKSGSITYLNIMILSMTWFALGYNYYGNMNSWRNISPSSKTFEHNFLMTTLAGLAKILALMICLFVRRKCFPMAILQVVMALTYFCIISLHPEKIDITDKTMYQELSSPVNTLIFLAHMTSFWATASFELIWVITPETFPKKFR